MFARKRVGEYAIASDFLKEVPTMDLLTLYISEKIAYATSESGSLKRVMMFEDALRERVEKLEELNQKVLDLQYKLNLITPGEKS